jgi:1-acyl-sn-glycerol-3-phosphate acyltransferase
MILILRSLWIWFATAALILLWLPLLGIIRLFDREPRRLVTGRWFRRLGRMLAKVNPWRLHITGTERVQPGGVYVVVSNHQSLADIPVISHVMIDTKWLGKAELFRLPVVGWMMKMAGDVPVQRGDRRKAAQAMMQCSRYVRERVSVVFFPEGTRSRDGEMLPFNDGPFRLAIRDQVPLLPMVVEGSGSALPRNTWLFGGTSDIYLTVLDPVSVEGLVVDQLGQLRDSVRQKMIDELHRLRELASQRTAMVTPG